MSHVAQQECVDLVGDLPELRGVDRARIGAAAADDQLRAHLLREPQHLVVVDDVRLARHAVVRDRVEPAGEVHLQPVREVAAVRELERQDRLARLQRRHVDRHVRLRARVRLHVRVLRAEQLLRAVDRRLLDLVDDLAAAVVPLAGVTLRVLVRRDGAHRLEHRRPCEVLRRDQLDLATLALELLREQLGYLRIDLGEAGCRQVLERLVRDGHAGLLPAVSSDATRGVGAGPTPSRVCAFGRPPPAEPRMARGIAVVLAFLSVAWPTGQAVADGGGRIVVRAWPGTSDAQLRSALGAHGLSLGRRIPHTRDYAVNGQAPPTQRRRLPPRGLAYARSGEETERNPPHGTRHCCCSHAALPRLAHSACRRGLAGRNRRARAGRRRPRHSSAATSRRTTCRSAGTSRTRGSSR